jgi:hypothetical protein
MYGTTTGRDGSIVPVAQFMFGGARGHIYNPGQDKKHANKDALAAYTSAASPEEIPHAMPRDPWLVHFAYPATCGTATHVDCFGAKSGSSSGYLVYPYTNAHAAPMSATLARLHAPSVFTPTTPADFVTPPMTYAARVAAEDLVKPIGH